MKFSGKVGSGPMNNRLNFGGDPNHHLDTGIVFQIRHYWPIQKVLSTDCNARRCSGEHALAGIAIATITSLRLRLFAEVCTVPVLLVVIVIVIVIRNKCRSLLRWEEASKNVIHYDWVMAKTTILFHSIPGCTGPPTNKLISGYNLSRLLLQAGAFLAPKQQCQSTERTSTVT